MINRTSFYYLNEHLGVVVLMSPTIKRNLRGSSVKAIITSAIAILSIIVAANAYRTYFMPGIGPQVSVSSYPLKLTMRLDTTDVAAGENVSMHFTLTNLSNDSVKITYTGINGDEESEFPRGKKIHYMVFGYVVSNETGATVYSRGGGPSLASLWSFTLVPLEEVSQTVIWNRNLVRPDGLSAPPGIYNIRGIIPPGALMSIDGGPWITIETPAIAVVVK